MPESRSMRRCAAALVCLAATLAVALARGEVAVTVQGHAVAIACGDQVIADDDYCDCLDGSDETKTAACSHLSVVFTCPGMGQDTITIPTSRVQDGVCDCCDGSDEVGSPFGSCPDQCQMPTWVGPSCRNAAARQEWTDHLQVQRKDALGQYRRVQSGLRARSAIVQKWKSQRDADRKSYTKVIEEHRTVVNLMLQMRYFLSVESQREESLRWSLIREREHHCALGYDHMCDVFAPQFFTDMELADFGFQARYLAELAAKAPSPTPTPTPQSKRFVYTYSVEEIRRANSLQGPARVRAAQCLVESLLPDDDVRIFAEAGDYLNFMNSPGGSTHRANMNERRRQRENIFNKFLDSGERGYNNLWVVACELVGLAASPLVLTAHTAVYALHVAGELLWSHLHRAHTAHVAQAAVVSGADSGGSSDPTPLSPISVQLLEQAQAAMQYLAAHVAQLLLDWDDEHSWLHQRIVRYLDARRYALVASALDQLQPWLATPQWVLTAVAHAPLVYLDYYLWAKGAHLPARRQACLLRQGIRLAQEEAARLERQIRDYEQVRALLAQGQGVGLAMSEVEGNPLLRDYGPLGEWQAVADLCVSSTLRAHNVTFCFFQSLASAQQSATGAEGGTGVVSLGQFAHWGTDPAALSRHRLLQHYLAQSAQHEQVAEDWTQRGGDAWGLRDLFRALATLPSDSWRFLYRRLRPSAEDVVAAVVVVQQAQATLFGRAVVPALATVSTDPTDPAPGPDPAEPDPAPVPDTPVQAPRRRGKGRRRGGDGPSLAARLNATLTVYLERLQRGIIDYNATFHLLQTPFSQSEGLDLEMQDYYGLQSYVRGAVCPHGPSPDSRYSSLVHFECGASHAITSIEEVKACKYEVRVATPLACSAYLEQRALEQLDQLGVFGFSSKKTSQAKSTSS